MTFTNVLDLLFLWFINKLHRAEHEAEKEFRAAFVRKTSDQQEKEVLT